MAIQIGDALWKIGADLTALKTGLAEGLDEVQKSTEAVAGKLRTIGAGMTAVGGAITGAFGLAAHAAAEFSEGMGELNTLGVENLDALSKGIRDVSSQFGQELGPTAKATYDIISAGIPEENALDFLAASAKAAVAGVTDVSTAVDLGTSVINAFGMEAAQAGEVFDLAFTAVKQGKTTMDELGASVGKVAPTFAAAGLGADEMFASIAALTTQGIATSEAATRMNAVIAAVVKPTSEAAKAAQALGLEFNVASLQSKGLEGFLKDVQEATGGNIETMSQLFSSTEALSAVLALTGNGAEKLGETLDAMTQSQNATDEAFQKFVDANPAFAFQQLKATAAALAVEVGQVVLPVLIDLARAVLPLIQRFREWMETNPKVAKTVLMVVAAIGGIMTALGPILIALPQIIGFVTTFGGVLAAIATGPVGIIIGAIIGLVTVFKIFENEIIAVIRNVILWFGNLVDRVVGAINKVREFFGLSGGGGGMPDPNFGGIGPVAGLNALSMTSGLGAPGANINAPVTINNPIVNDANVLGPLTETIKGAIMSDIMAELTGAGLQQTPGLT